MKMECVAMAARRLAHRLTVAARDMQMLLQSAAFAGFVVCWAAGMAQSSPCPVPKETGSLSTILKPYLDNRQLVGAVVLVATSERGDDVGGGGYGFGWNIGDGFSSAQRCVQDGCSGRYQA